jgi:hypothetical protein
MSGKREGACHAEGYKQVGEVGGESVDVVGVHRCRRGIAVATVVVADDPDAVAVLIKQVIDLDGPGVFVQAEPVEKDDGMGGVARSVFAHRQRHAVACRYRSRDAGKLNSGAVAHHRAPER